MIRIALFNLCECQVDIKLLCGVIYHNHHHPLCCIYCSALNGVIHKLRHLFLDPSRPPPVPPCDDVIFWGPFNLNYSCVDRQISLLFLL